MEALGDVQVLPATAHEAQVIEALGRLRAAKLLAGVRGALPADIDAVAKIATSIGRLIRAIPEISEIEINPLMVHARGEGATALDALIVGAG